MQYDMSQQCDEQQSNGDEFAHTPPINNTRSGPR
eukprot:COSAG05_NODE_10154_length_580_cov_1.392931_1_plen_33_part_01